ncbi:MAG TPA: FecR domain-containing protein, partial [Gammaproteobacteria bacterium]|nr:FecR domain-containing protein [Gammaproteobacteria bacterium]
IQGDVRVQYPTETNWRQLDRSTGPIVAGSRVRATPTGRVALELPGALSLRIDATTELTVHSARELELVRGTIYVDSGQTVATDSLRVMTGLGVVSDIGTQFELTASETLLRIRVREGAVRVDGSPTDAEVLGRAGEQLSLDADGGFERDPFSPFDADWAWVQTLADTPVIEGQSLMFFLDWVARETGRPLRFDAPVTETRARTVVLHGSAENLSPMEALDVMLSTTDFDYRLRDDGAIVISARVRGQAPVR